MSQSDYPDFDHAVARLQQFLARNSWPVKINWIQLVGFEETRESCEIDARLHYYGAVKKRLGVALEARFVKNGISHVAVTSPRDRIEQEHLMYPDGLKLSVLENGGRK